MTSTGNPMHFLADGRGMAGFQRRLAFEHWQRVLQTASVLALMAGTGLMPTPADAAVVTWSGSASSADWFQSGNWIRSPSGIPATGDTIYIGNTTAGAAANGTVAIGPGSAQGSTLYLGYAIGTSGDLTVLPGANLDVSTLGVGRLGTGSLAIAGGTVNVSGTFGVGGYTGANAGSGHLRITDGGVLNKTSSSYTYVGYRTGAPTSTVLIDGQGSTWNTYGGVIAGGSGNGSGTITVQNGGQLVLTNPSGSNTNLGLGLADRTNATGSLTIDGPGSKVTTTPGITVGIAGKAYLSIRNGAVLESSADEADYDYLGYIAPSAVAARAEGHVIVDGQGSSWVNHTGLMVGYTGIGTMTISNGGSVASTYGSYIGVNAITGAPAAAHGEVLITGPGSIWTAATLDMARFNGATAILTVADGGTLRTTDPAGIRSVGNGGQGAISIGAPQADAAAAPGKLDTPIVNLGEQGSLVFNHTSPGYTFAPQIGSVAAGNGAVNQLAGTTILTGNSGAFEGSTAVAGGTLRVDGTLGSSVSTVDVASGGTLGGSGTIGGNVAIASGGILAPNAAGSASASTLAINGNLALSSGAILNYNFGQPDVVGGALNDLTIARGDLTLDGTLDVTQTTGGSFDPGIYRVISYDGSWTNPGGTLALGSLPAGNIYSVQTSVAQQVNLVVNSALNSFTFWNGEEALLHGNGTVNGGDGRWQHSAGNTNWTDQTGVPIGGWDDGNFTIFMAKPGMVTVDNSLGQVTASGMQFASHGYVIRGGDIALFPDAQVQSIIRVGDGSSLGAGYTATIESNLTGATQLVKHDVGTLVLTGANSYSGGTAIGGGTLRVAADNNLGAVSGALSFDGGTLNTTASFVTARAVHLLAEIDPALPGLGGTFDVNGGAMLTLSGAIDGAGSLTKAAAGTLMLTNANNGYSGDTFVNAGILRAGAAHTFSPNSATTVANAGTLDLAGFSQTVGGLANAGTVNLGTNTAAGTVLTVAGDYTGNGGTVSLNTHLGDDDSPTDRLVVQGSTSGSSRLVITNAGGLGALTTGNGIKVVEVQGDSAGSFALGDRVAAGLYEYTLNQGGLRAADGNWYLRSEVRPAVPLASAMLPLATEYGYALLDTLHERVGELWGNGVSAASERPNAAWVRVLGNRGSHDGADRNDARDFLRNGPQYDYTVEGIQSGVNLYDRESADGTLDRAGLYLGLGRISADVDDIFRNKAGSIDMDAYSLGAYWTHRSPDRWYTDAVLQGTYYSADAHSVRGEHVKPNGWGVLASLEGGYAVPLNERVTLEPQAQMIYQRISLDNTRDAYGVFRFDEDDSLRGRLGLRLSRSWTSDVGGTQRPGSAWIRANVWHEFQGDSKTTVGTLDGAGDKASVTSSLGGSWGEIGVGVAGPIGKQANLFGTGSYSHSIDGNGREGWGLRLGVSWQF